MNRRSSAFLLALVYATAASLGCASIPKERYGITSLEFQGIRKLDEQSLRACLATHERPSFSFNLGRSADPECGVPPFEGGRINVSLWRWPWTDWPLYDSAVFERDLDRIERWYRARGFYDARVQSVRIEPPGARDTDRIEQDTVCDRDDDDEGCRVSMSISVEEGEPVIIERVVFRGAEGLPRDLKDMLEEALLLHKGERFDEALYDQSIEAFRQTLAEESYARARVTGRVTIDPPRRRATVEYTIQPGPPCFIGRISVTGEEQLPKPPILGAALIKTGDIYRQSEIEEAQRAIYALGAFSSVEVAPQVDETSRSNLINIEIRVVPGRLTRFGLGAGIQSGTFQILESAESIDVPQWDVHLLGFYEHRNLFGGLRRFRIEERPRLIFQDVFPQPVSPGPGNLLSMEFRQPSFIENRTRLVATARWDLGPDPFRGRFFRHDLDARVGPERYFFDSRLFLSLGIHGNLYLVQGRDSIDEGVSVPSDYHVTFLEQYARLDLRDDPRAPRYGGYFGIGVHEAGFGLPSTWDYIRVTPEVRGYAPLPYGLVLASRFAIGAMFISDASSDLGNDSISRERGPERYRLRGGGASSNRGFLPGQLGVGLEGGIRRWEASLELRVPVSVNFGMVFFSDFGYVSDDTKFYFNYAGTSVGLGFRYLTIVGPLRIDFGYRVPGMQVIGGPDKEAYNAGNPLDDAQLPFGLLKWPGAVHLTIGEAF